MIGSIENLYLRRLLVILATVPLLSIFLLLCILGLVATTVTDTLRSIKWEVRGQLGTIKSFLGCIQYAWAKRGEA